MSSTRPSAQRYIRSVNIDPEWREPCELAWESLTTGSFPVGAVIRDAAGDVVAVGRNRRVESTVPPGQLGNTALAHAEMNALAQLPPVAYHDHTLYTTLEPCLLCTSALRICRVGEVRYLAPDPIWDGVADIPTLLSEQARRTWTRRVGPLTGPLATFCEALTVHWYLRHAPHMVSDHQRDMELVTLVETLRTAGVFDCPTATDALNLADPALLAYENANLSRSED